MGMLPVALSIFVTFQSAISLMGVPSEVYLYGPMLIGQTLGVGLSYIIGSFVMVPLMYPLKLTSMFEYIELRYQSRAVRKLATITGMLQTFFYMIIAMLAPGLAIQATTGTPFWVSVIVVGCIGTLYTAIGGIKSVIWTDAFQAMAVCVGISLSLIVGTIKIGSVEQVYEIGKAGGRTAMDEIGIDPRIRHSWWGLIIGGTATWMTNIFNQSTLQRISSMKSMRSAKIAFILNFPINFLYAVLLGFMGIVIYAYFFTIKCGPIEGGIVSNSNQLIFYYISHLFDDYPGLAGLYMGTIFSGALSTLSSGINALATNTIEDFLSGMILKDKSEKVITITAKILVFVYGILIVLVAYLAKSVDGPINQMASAIFGVFGSVGLGMILAGCTLPWVNKYGALAGALAALIINAWISIGSRLYGAKQPLLSPVTTEACSVLYNNNTIVFDAQESTNYTYSTEKSTIETVDTSTNYGFFLYDISYQWYSLIGTTIGIAVNIIVSKLTNSLCKIEPDSKLILPILRRRWQLETVETHDPSEYRLEAFPNAS